MPADKKRKKEKFIYGKKRISRKLYRIAYIIIGAILAMLPKLPVLASSTTESVQDAANELAESVTRPVRIINNVIVVVAAVIGVFIFLKGLITEFIPGIQGRDLNSTIQGIFMMLVGIILIFLKLFLSLAGITI